MKILCWFWGHKIVPEIPSFFFSVLILAILYVVRIKLIIISSVLRWPTDLELSWESTQQHENAENWLLVLYFVYLHCVCQRQVLAITVWVKSISFYVHFSSGITLPFATAYKELLQESIPFITPRGHLWKVLRTNQQTHLALRLNLRLGRGVCL